MKLSLHTPFRMLSLLSSAGILGLISYACLAPASSDSAHAAESSTEINVNVQPIISIGLGDTTVAFDVVQTEAGTFGYNSTTLSVSTNNSSGYSIYLYTQNGASTLAGSVAGNNAVISPVEGGSLGVTSSNFGPNTWGYSLSQDIVSDTTAYKAVPTANGVTAATTDAPSSGDTYNLTFAANVNNELPADTYTNSVVVSAVANPAAVSSLTELTYMQDMTTATCNSSAVGDTTQLIDSRDGKSYWVAKLADNNCWMTQNLDYDLDPDVALTPLDSDVTRNWMPDVATSTTVFNNSDNDGVYSYDAGLYVNTQPNNLSSSCNGVTSLADPACSNAGFTDVSDLTAISGDNASGTVISGDNYDAHYLIGNYYQWHTATAGTGTSSSDNTPATDSICPKGWKLPTGSPSSPTIEDSFYNLLNAYGMTNKTNGVIASSPTYLQYGGSIYNGVIQYAGYNGNYWTSMGYTSSNVAYSLYFSNSVTPADVYLYYNGFTVRCVAK